MMMKPFRNLLSSGILSAAMAATPILANAQNAVPSTGYQLIEECELQIFFPVNVTALTPTQATAIDEFVVNASTDEFAIRGYASNIGDAQNNVRLSQGRAQSAAAIVQRRGERVSASAFGEAGDGPFFQRADLLREDCAAALIEEAAAAEPSARGAGPLLGVGAGLGLLLLLTGGGSSDGT